MSKVISTLTSGDIGTSPSPGQAIEYEFVIENGNTGILSISDPLLDTYERDEARALSEMLRNSYMLRTVGYKRPQSKGRLNNIAEVEGLPYITKDITIDIEEVVMSFDTKGVRYE